MQVEVITVVKHVCGTGLAVATCLLRCGIGLAVATSLRTHARTHTHTHTHTCACVCVCGAHNPRNAIRCDCFTHSWQTCLTLYPCYSPPRHHATASGQPASHTTLTTALPDLMLQLWPTCLTYHRCYSPPRPHATASGQPASHSTLATALPDLMLQPMADLSHPPPPLPCYCPS